MLPTMLQELGRSDIPEDGRMNRVGPQLTDAQIQGMRELYARLDLERHWLVSKKCIRKLSREEYLRLGKVREDMEGLKRCLDMVDARQG